MVMENHLGSSVNPVEMVGGVGLREKYGMMLPLKFQVTWK